MDAIDTDETEMVENVDAFITNSGGDPTTYKGKLIAQIIQTALKLMTEDHDLGQLKVISRSIKEMRYAYNIFQRYKDAPCVSIFGSARTPEDHPDYIAAKDFSAQMAQQGWMCITGAANGIMKAGLEGPKKTQNFGLSILLPFETSSNTIIEGDPKLIHFRFFFTRKLMFMSHSDALAAFPGGVGTLDELFEMLTLMQTGKANIVPIVLVEGANGTYWEKWKIYMESILKERWISPEDTSFYHFCPTPEEAVQHILKFYSRFHSSRYVKDIFVIRMRSPLSEDQVEILNTQFASLLAEGKISLSGPLIGETDHLELPRIIFNHTRREIGKVRQLIDAINNF
ncbi:MAG TPA: LOG family protein [Parachlamydiaceae bacterium]|nr:LOG family protein [Parachlamydiaceae bacterium]